MPTRIRATDLARNLSDVLNRVRYRGEHFVVERNGEPVATLSPSFRMPDVTLGEVARRLADLALPGEGFGADLERIQLSQERAEPPAWPSS